MKVSDYIANFFAQHGSTFVSGLQGGASAHLFDSFERFGIRVQYAHHEQHAGQAAVGFSRYTGKIGVVISTTGPAGTNLMTPLLAAWQDSIPVFFISGQARRTQLSYNRLARQVGSQESNVLDYVRPLTKRAVLVGDPAEIPFVLESSFEAARSGRPGPVWLDIPVDVQWANLESMPRIHRARNSQSLSFDLLRSRVSAAIETTTKVVLLVGGGLRESGNTNRMRSLLGRASIPLVATWGGLDFVGDDFPFYCGLVGPFGHPAANRLIEEAQLVIAVGADLGVNQVRAAMSSDSKVAHPKYIVVCSNPDQLSVSAVKIDDVFVGEIEPLLECVVETLVSMPEETRNFFASVPVKAALENEMPPLSCFADRWPLPAPLIVRELTAGDARQRSIFIDGGGTALYAGFQAGCVRSGDRVICSTAVSSMGTALDEYVGASSVVQSNLSLVIIGDGSFQMSLPSLGVVAKCHGPTVILVLNNSGYAAIRHTQRDYLGDRRVGVSPEDVKYGSVEMLCAAFGLRYFRVDSQSDLSAFQTVFCGLSEGVVVCEAVVCPDANTAFSPVVSRDARGQALPGALSSMRSYWDDYAIKRL